MCTKPLPNIWCISVGRVWKPRRSSCQAHAKAIDKQLRHTKPGVVDVSGPRVPLLIRSLYVYSNLYQSWLKYSRAIQRTAYSFATRAASGLPLTTAFREHVSDAYVRCRVSRSATVGARARKGIAPMGVMNVSHARRSRQNGKRGSATH